MSGKIDMKGARGTAIAILLMVTVLITAWYMPSVIADLQLIKPDPAVAATFFGHGGYSADGLGRLVSAPGNTIQADVPAGSTVKKAWLYVATFGTSPNNPPTINVNFDGTVVTTTWLPNNETPFLDSYRAEVTSQVAAKVGSGGGITNFVITGAPSSVDGFALVVIFENMALPERSIFVLDGGSTFTAQTTTVNFAQPIDKTLTGFEAIMSIGSSFSYQGGSGLGTHICGTGSAQSSLIDVNSVRLTSCAGNYDDGFGANGGLMTVGGVGDSTDNPADPFQQPADGKNPRITDDELYDLAPFINNGDTQMVIKTQNPSNNDQIFLAVIEVTAQAVIAPPDTGGSIHGMKFDDTNGNGVKDPGEPGINGWTIVLYTGASTTHTATATTATVSGSDGVYSFTGLAAGTYKVCEVLMTGWTETLPNAGTTGNVSCGGLTPPTGTTLAPFGYSVTLASGGTSSNNDFGNFKKITISGVKYDDKNGNGARDLPGDTGIQNWKIRLDKSGTNAAPTCIGGTIVTEGTDNLCEKSTDANGNYEFPDLGPNPGGNYDLREVQQTGWTQTKPAGNLYTIPAVSGAYSPGNEFGNFKKFKITGIKFDDKNGDGVKDAGDNGLSGWEIKLANTGTLSSPKSPVITPADDPATPAVNEAGTYSFNDLGPGTYVVSETTQAAYTQTAPDIPGSGTWTIIGVSGADQSDKDFGNFKNFKITGVKFDDKNGSGVKDAGDTGLSGWTISLANTDVPSSAGLSSSRSPVITPADDPATPAVNEAGTYEFANLGPGTYVVSETTQAGWTQTAPDIPGSGTWTIIGVSGADQSDKDFGNFKNFKITGVKFRDTNIDGDLDSGEPPLSGWTISLANTGPLSSSRPPVVTAAGPTPPLGTYEFANLGPGTYVVSETLQAGWTQTGPLPVPPGTYTIVGVSGVDVPNQNFANAQSDLFLVKTGNLPAVKAGQQLVYTLVVTNNGPSNNKDIVLKDMLPAEVTFNSVTSTQGTCFHDGSMTDGTVTCNLGNLAVGASASVFITVTVNADTTVDVVNEANVKGAISDPSPDPSTNEAMFTSRLVEERGSNFEVRRGGSFIASTAAPWVTAPGVGFAPNTLQQMGSGTEITVRSGLVAINVNNGLVTFFNPNFPAPTPRSNPIVVEKILLKQNDGVFETVAMTFSSLSATCNGGPVTVGPSGTAEATCLFAVITIKFNVLGGTDNFVIEYTVSEAAPAKQKVIVTSEGTFRLEERLKFPEGKDIEEFVVALDGTRVEIPDQGSPSTGTFAITDPRVHMIGQPLTCVGITSEATAVSMTCEVYTPGKVLFITAEDTSLEPTSYPQICSPSCRDGRVTFSVADSPDVSGKWRLKVIFKNDLGNVIATKEDEFFALTGDQLRDVVFNEGRTLIHRETVPLSVLDKFIGMEPIPGSNFKSARYIFGDFMGPFTFDPLIRGTSDPNIDAEISANPASASTCPTGTTSPTGTAANTLGEFVPARAPPSNAAGQKCIRGFLEWNVPDAMVPDSAVIKNVAVRFDFEGDSPAPSTAPDVVINPVACQFTSMLQVSTTRPSTLTGTAANQVTLWKQIGDGAYTTSPACPTLALGSIALTQTINLGPVAATDMQSNLVRDWFAVGYKLASEAIDGSENKIALRSEDYTRISPFTLPRLEITFELSPAVAFRSTTALPNSPKYSEWSPTANAGAGGWGALRTLQDSGSPVRFAELAFSPISSKRIIVTQSDDGNLDAYVCTLSCSSSTVPITTAWTFSSNIGNVGVGNERRFDVAFETATGDAIVVYSVVNAATDKDLAYKVLPAATSSFTGITEQYIDDIETPEANKQYTWISLDRDPVGSSQELIVTGFDSTGSGGTPDINAWVWSGSSWGNRQEITADAGAAAGGEALAVKYSADGTKGMVLGVDGSTGNVAVWHWIGTAPWVNTADFDIDTTDDFDAKWLTVKARPGIGTNDDLQVVIVDNDNDLHTAYWDGLAWFVTSNIDGGAGTTVGVDTNAARPADFEWDPSGASGRLVWDTDTTGTTLSQIICSPQCTGATSTIVPVPASSFAGTGAWIAMSSNPDPLATSTPKIVGARLHVDPANAAQPDLGSFKFDGTNYRNLGDAILTGNTGVTTFESFRIAWQLA